MPRRRDGFALKRARSFFARDGVTGEEALDRPEAEAEALRGQRAAHLLKGRVAVGPERRHDDFVAGFDAIAATMSLGSSVGYEDAPNERLIWLAPDVINRLRAMRGPGESYSDVILRPAKG